MTFIWPTYNNEAKQRYYRIVSKMFMSFILCINDDIPTNTVQHVFIPVFHFINHGAAVLPFGLWLSIPWPLGTNTPSLYTQSSRFGGFQNETKGYTECWEEAESLSWSFPAYKFFIQTAHGCKEVSSASEEIAALSIWRTTKGGGWFRQSKPSHTITHIRVPQVRRYLCLAWG